MPAPKPPIASLFVWLAVSALLLAGAPARQQPTGEAGNQRLATFDVLAKAFAALDLAPSPDLAQLPLARTGEVADAPSVARAAVPDFSFPCWSALRPACTAVVPRLSLVGMIELRI
jgi:hypothetical protein